jgi:hypothetical protein
MISQGAYTLASFAPMIVNTSDQVVSRFSPAVRDCYKDEEFHLKTLTWKNGYRYSMKNCLYASLLEKVLSNCSCVPDYHEMPENNAKSFPKCR